MEKYKERRRDLHMVFLYLEKAYDNVPRGLREDIKRGKGASRRYIRVIQDVYEGAETCVRTPLGSVSR